MKKKKSGHRGPSTVEETGVGAGVRLPGDNIPTHF